MDSRRFREIVWLPVQLWQTLKDLWVEGDDAYELHETLTSPFVIRCLQVALDANNLKDAHLRARQVEKELVQEGRMDYTADHPVRVAMLRAVLTEDRPKLKPPVFAVQLFKTVSEALAWDEVAPRVGNISSIPALPHASRLKTEVGELAAGIVRAYPPTKALVYHEDEGELRVDEDLWKDYVRHTIRKLKELV